MNRAIFFDRDDTLIKNVPYLGDPGQVKLMPHASRALKLLQEAGYLIFMISNQSGVGRGWITEKQVELVNQEIIRQLGKNYFSKIYICFDDPENPVENCRKPSPKMIFTARDDFNLDLKNSFFIGDKLLDIEAGKNAGCKTILMQTNQENMELQTAMALADFKSKELLEAANLILNF